MRGRYPETYTLSAGDRRGLSQIVADGQIAQRIATRARALLALDRGERIVEIARWLEVSRTTLWYLWQRYRQRGLEAAFDEERSGRPAVFSPARTSPHRADGLHRARQLWRARDPLGLSHLATSGRGADDGGVNSLH